MRLRLAEAMAVSAIVIVAAPYVGQIRGAIQAALPGQYRLIIGGTIAIGVGAAIVHALIRIRERRLLRYSLIAVAIAIGTIYAAVTATGNPLVDVVERFHFVEYGFITLLFYRAWHDRANVAVLLFPLLAGTMIGTLDEAVQWLVPARVGELHDVLLDLVAVVCGLVFSAGVQPPLAIATRLDRGARRELAVFVAACVTVVAGFFHVVHLGHEVDGGEAGRFLSRFTAAQLEEAAKDRAVRWRQRAPNVLHRFSIEDHYLAEGVWHVQRRNEGTGLHTWKENMILERFFDPVLQFPTYSTPSGARWSVEQRANVEAREAGHDGPYVSEANPYPIYTWNPVAFWTVVAGLIAALVFVIVRTGPTA
jgi:VanZ family protein